MTAASGPWEAIAARATGGGRLRRAWPLGGGVSATVVAMDVQVAGGEVRRLVARAHGARDLARNPRAAADEYALLRYLHGSGLPVPEPVYLDESCALLPQPYLVLGYIDGEVLLAPPRQGEPGPGGAEPLPRQMALALEAIHRLDPAPLAFLAPSAGRAQEWLDQLSQAHPRTDLETQAGDRLAAGRGELTRWVARPALLHGDFWPGNLLWRDGRLAGIVDWEDAAAGDPLLDLAGARLELWWSWGPEASEEFTRHYRQAAGLDRGDLERLPWWDLLAGLKAASQMAGWGLPPGQEGAMRARLADFLKRALAAPSSDHR